MARGSRVVWTDRIARWVITLGGLSILGSMLLMILFMIWVTLPLAEDASSRRLEHFPAPSRPVAFALSPYGERAFVVDDRGWVRVVSSTDGRLLRVERLALPEGATRLLAAEETGYVSPDSRRRYALTWDDGSTSLIEFVFQTRFDEDGTREVLFSTEALDTLTGPADAPLPALVRRYDQENLVILRALAADRLQWERRIAREGFTGEVDLLRFSADLRTPAAVTATALGSGGRIVYAGLATGNLETWDLSIPEQPKRLGSVRVSEGAVTAMCMLLGDVTLVTGDDRGRLRAWNLLPDQPARPVEIHELPSHDAPITALIPSRRGKRVAGLDRDGVLQLSQVTTERLLLRFDDDAPLVAFSLGERGDSLMGLDVDGVFRLWALEVAHPEVSVETLWSKVHYEGYPAPVYTWQSSSASDDFEPKLSLVPLLWGSLKGTFYGLLFALPLALMAAICVSQMMRPYWRAIVKPVMELMAAVPSVVIGFLAALWLAPVLEGNLVGLALLLGSVPLVSLAVLTLFTRRGFRISGHEVWWCLPLVAGAVWAAFSLGDWVEYRYFGDHFELWLFHEAGIQVDRLNSIVIAFALGFAVIPIVFTISEEALSNVPPELIAASTALGGSRWQTVRRVVLPVAAPGIFAAMMLGFSRAVGETMIVLMATGNTPIMSASMLDGMRTIPANIAIELPEAPVNGSLYRVLFLSAVLLFGLTFLVNTGAELVRRRLQKRIGGL